MQQVQLYIEDQRIELFKDETISLTETIQNVKDIAKVFTDFTKTFSVPATKETNKIFKHYYNFDIVGGFDARTKKSGSIKLNGVDFKKGKIKLEGVDLKNNKADVYRITFFGDLVLLKDLIGEDKLDSLPFLDEFTLEYSPDEVKTKLQVALDKTVNGEDFEDVILAPLISCSERLYYDSHVHNEDDGNLYFEQGTGHRHGVRWDDLKYAIKVYAIIRAIEEKYDIEFTKNGSGDFITNVDDTTSLWGSLYLWLHRKSGKYETSVEGASYSRFIDNFEVKTVASYTENNHTWSVVSEGDAFVVSGFGTQQLDGRQGYCYLFLDTEPSTPYLNSKYTIKHYVDGVLVDTVPNVSGVASPNFFVTQDGTHTFEVLSDDSMTFIDVTMTASIRNASGTFAEDDVSTTSNVVLAQFEFYPTQQIPEMKVIDFITGLFKTFNLTAYVQDNGKIKLQTLDTFYANQSTDSPYDITEFVDVNSSKVNVALPFSKVKFVFKESKSLLAAKFNQLNNKQYGQLEYNADSPFNFVGKEYKVEVPWEKMLYERLTDQATQGNPIADDDIEIQYGLMKDENNQNYLSKPLLFLADYKHTGSQPISFVDGVSHDDVDRYFAPSHTVELGDATTQTLLYSSEVDTYSKNLIEESLFENYYKEYIQDVFNEKRRLTKIKAFLPLRILLKYTLADTFIIAGKEYKINSITTNLQTGESDMELLNVV